MDPNSGTSQNSSFEGLIGVAQSDITPPINIYSRNWGAAEHDIAEGIHRPLILTCITFQASEKDKPLVLIGADLGFWKNSAGELIFRDKILKSLNLEPSNLMFCLSHTHAGPSICRDDVSNTGGELIEPYLDFVVNATVEATKRAVSTASKSTLTWAYGKCNLASNRDLPQSEKNRFVVGFNPTQKADDTLLVGRVTNNDNKIVATIINYACHPTTLAWQNRLISPDYVGSMRELVESGTQAPCLFLQGASGELAPAQQYTGDVKVADKHGRRLGYSVMAVLESMQAPKKEISFVKVVESGAPLALWEASNYHPQTSLSCKLIEVEYNLKELPSLQEIEAQYDACEDRVIKERIWRKRGIRVDLGDGDTVKVMLWVWKLGNSLLIGQPNESYSEFQIKVRDELSPVTVAVMNLVNGSIGYLPPAGLYPKDIYSVWQSPFAAGSLEKLTEIAINSAKDLLATNFT